MFKTQAQPMHVIAPQSQVVWRGQSPYQTIEFMRTQNGLSLFLNNEVQFTEWHERPYHEALAGTAVQGMAPNVLVLGGGDGLAARTIYERCPYANVWLAELDPEMIRICQTLPPMVALNQQALSRTRTIIGDAQVSIQGIPDRSMDTVIVDFPDKAPMTASLYGPGMYQQIFRVLRKNGQVSAYSGGDLSGVVQVIRHTFGEAQQRRADLCGLSCAIIQGVKHV